MIEFIVALASGSYEVAFGSLEEAKRYISESLGDPDRFRLFKVKRIEIKMMGVN